MTARRMFRANQRPAEERALHEKLQKERPSLEDLIRTGACDPDTVMTMGTYFDLQRTFQALKREREQCSLSIGDLAEWSGLDRADRDDLTR